MSKDVIQFKGFAIIFKTSIQRESAIYLYFGFMLSNNEYIARFEMIGIK